MKGNYRQTLTFKKKCDLPYKSRLHIVQLHAAHGRASSSLSAYYRSVHLCTKINFMSTIMMTTISNLINRSSTKLKKYFYSLKKCSILSLLP